MIRHRPKRLFKIRGGRDAAPLAATIVGLAPGLLLPFAIPLRFDATASDVFFLAMSLALVMTNVVVASIEANTVAYVGRSLGRGERPGWRDVRAYTRRSFELGGLAIAVAMPLLFAVFAIRDARWVDGAAIVLTLALVPIVGSATAVLAGLLIASGRSTVPIATQGLRSLVPLCALLSLSAPSLQSVAWFYLCGEVLRAAIMMVWSWRLGLAGAQQSTKRSAKPDGLALQFGATGISQGNPVVDRLVLASGEPGNITSYELADKVYFALYQVVYSGLMLRRLSGWAARNPEQPLSIYSRFRRDVWHLALITLVLSLIAMGAIAASLGTDLVPTAWEGGFTWALVLLPSTALSIVMISSMRFLVILSGQRLLFAASLVGFAVNSAADIALFALLGPIGVPVATVVTRIMMATLLLWAIARIYTRDRESLRGSDLREENA